MLYEQRAFGDSADHVQEDQEQEFVISPERRVSFQELQRRVGELVRDAPGAEKARGGTASLLAVRPGPRRPGRAR